MDEKVIEIQIKSKRLEQVTNDFILHIESLSETFPMVTNVLKVTSMAATKKFNEFLKEECDPVVVDEEGQVVNEEGKLVNDKNRIAYLIPTDKSHKRNILRRKSNNAQQASELIPRSFLVSLVSEFDAFIGNLIRCIFYLRPEILNSSEKNLSFSKLLELSNIEEAREFLIEKEVESVLRESHTAQFKWLENKLDLKLTVDLPSWTKFIELTERRNLYVHADGLVSNQYLAVCKSCKVELDEKVKMGIRLKIDQEYFYTAYRCLFEIGVKLSQVIWRKLIPEETYHADAFFIGVVYDQIVREDYKLAIELAEFSTHKVIKHFNDEFRLTCIMNKAQAYKWNGDDEKCCSIIKQIDWSAYSDKFKLVSLVLLEKYQEASGVMVRVGNKHEDITVDAYRNWPIFKSFRKTEEFKITYKNIFGKDFDNKNLDEAKELDIF